MTRRVAIGCGLAWMAGVLGGCSELDRYRHRRVRARIDNHVQQAMQSRQGATSNSTPFAKLDDANARWELLRAFNTALANHFWYPTGVDPDKFLAVANRLDQTGGEDLKTVQGCLLIMDMLEASSPTAKDYAWFAAIHEAQAEGNIPKLDRSKLP